MDKREMLKSMLNNYINDKPEEATLDLHNYLSSKMREISGLESGVKFAAQDSDDSDVTDSDATV